MRGVFALIWLMAWCGPAQGDEMDEARQHFQEGLRHYDQGRWAEAVSEFQTAQRLHPKPELDYNIGRAYDRLGDWSNAISAYRRYVDAEPFAADAPAVRTRIDELKGKLAPARESGALRVVSSPSGAELRVDDDKAPPLGQTPHELGALPVGAHVVFLRKPGFLPLSRGVTIKRGETVQLELSLLPEPVAQPERRSRAWLAGPAVGAVGVAATVVFVVLYELSGGFEHSFGARNTAVLAPVVGK